MTTGILAVQGDFDAHRRALVRAGQAAVLVRKPADLDGVDALVLPGGESTAMLRALDRDGLAEPLASFVRSGRPVLGTCAGAILLARRVTNPEQRSFGAIDVDVARNDYGTQRDSFARDVESSGRFAGLTAIFIRAPRIIRVGAGVETLATVGDEPVLVRQGPVWAATFHPELAEDDRLVRSWLADAAGE